MRIGIDASALVGQFAGIGTCVYNLIKCLAEMDKENDYFLYAHDTIRLPFKDKCRWNLRITKGFLNKSSTFWKQTQARKDLLRDKIDLFWAPNAILPLNLPLYIKTVLTVNDLTWFYYPETLKWDNKIIFPLFFKRSLRKADRIIAISGTTAKELNELMPDIGDKIGVVYCGGASEQFKFDQINKTQIKSHFSSKFQTSAKYILTVGTIEPRKNLENLLRAYAILTRDNPGFDHQLLIAGGMGWYNSNIYKTYKRLNLSEKMVKFLGYIPQSDLMKLYSGAEVFIFPSFYEGFGFPPLEAMACGTPVVASNIPVFREILGDAALLVDPYKPEEIANGINRVLTDKLLADELRQKSLERVKLFSWEKAARETLEIFEKVKHNL